LRTIFPDGKTMHVPDNGRVLSQPGYAYAEAQWNQCHAVPCSNGAALKGGAASLGFSTMVAAATTSMTGKTFDDIHRGVNPGLAGVRDPGGINTNLPAAPQVAGSDDETADDSVAAGPAETAVTTVAIAAPIPLTRPATLDATASAPAAGGSTLMAAAQVRFDQIFPAAYNDVVTPDAPPARSPVPAQKSRDMVAATAGRPRDALGAIAAIEAPVPADRGSAGLGDPIVSAYAPIGPGTPAEHQLQALIENETTGAITPSHGTGLTNSVGSPIGADALKSYAADRRTVKSVAVIAAADFTARSTELIAPGFADALVEPVVFTSGSFAQFSQPTATDLDPATELGPMVARTTFHADASGSLDLARFAPGGAMLVASR